MTHDEKITEIAKAVSQKLAEVLVEQEELIGTIEDKEAPAMYMAGIAVGLMEVFANMTPPNRRIADTLIAAISAQLHLWGVSAALMSDTDMFTRTEAFLLDKLSTHIVDISEGFMQEAASLNKPSGTVH
jgi:hypothetical protein